MQSSFLKAGHLLQPPAWPIPAFPRKIPYKCYWQFAPCCQSGKPACRDSRRQFGKSEKISYHCSHFHRTEPLQPSKCCWRMPYLWNKLPFSISLNYCQSHYTENPRISQICPPIFSHGRYPKPTFRNRSFRFRGNAGRCRNGQAAVKENAIYSKIGIAGFTPLCQLCLVYFWTLMVSFTWVGLTFSALPWGVTSR